MTKYKVVDIDPEDSFYKDADNLIGEELIGTIEEKQEKGFVSGTFFNVNNIPTMTENNGEEFIFYKVKLKKI